MSPRRPVPAALLCLVLALVVSGCGETPGDILPDPRDGRSGLQASGIYRDRQIAISDGLPVLNTGDCDLDEGPDRDLCVVTEDISGELIRIIIENPDALEEGVSLPVGSDCRAAAQCDAVTDAAVVEFQRGIERRVRATEGTLTMEVVVEGSRYRGELDMRYPGGTLTATFDLIPRPEELS